MSPIPRLGEPPANIMATHLKFQFREFIVPMRLIGTNLVRESFDSAREYCDQLRDDMAARGQVEPIKLFVFPVGLLPDKKYVYWLQDGVHRFFAARELGWREIRAYIVQRPSEGVTTSHTLYVDLATPIKISESIYAGDPEFEEREDEPWRAIYRD